MRSYPNNCSEILLQYTDFCIFLNFAQTEKCQAQDISDNNQRSLDSNVCFLSKAIELSKDVLHSTTNIVLLHPTCKMTLTLWHTLYIIATKYVTVWLLPNMKTVIVLVVYLYIIHIIQRIGQNIFRSVIRIITICCERYVIIGFECM